MTIAPLYSEISYYRWPKDVALLQFFWNVLVPSESGQEWHAVARKVIGVVVCLGFSFAWVPIWLLAISMGNLLVYVKNTSFQRVNERFCVVLNEQLESVCKSQEEEWRRITLERDKKIGFRSLRTSFILGCVLLASKTIFSYLNE